MKILIIVTIIIILNLLTISTIGETKAEFYKMRSGYFTTTGDVNMTRTGNYTKLLICNYGIRATCIKYNERIFEWLNPQEGII